MTGISLFFLLLLGFLSCMCHSVLGFRLQSLFWTSKSKYFFPSLLSNLPFRTQLRVTFRLSVRAHPATFANYLSFCSLFTGTVIFFIHTCGSYYLGYLGYFSPPLRTIRFFVENDPVKATLIHFFSTHSICGFFTV